MKFYLLIGIIFASFSISSCQSEVKKSDIKTSKDSVSYAIGINIGKGMKKDNIDINPAVMLQGIKDALAKDSSYILSDADMQKTLMAFQQQMMKKQYDKMQADFEKNKKEGEAFLANNAKQTGVVVLPSGLQYKVIKSGNGPSPKETDKVKAHYRGTLINGTEFDNSYKRGEPVEFEVKGVIPGWTEALQKMKVGDKWMLYIPTQLAYGEQGGGQVIPPGAALVFEVELLSISK